MPEAAGFAPNKDPDPFWFCVLLTFVCWGAPNKLVPVPAACVAGCPNKEAVCGAAELFPVEPNKELEGCPPAGFEPKRDGCDVRVSRVRLPRRLSCTNSPCSPWKMQTQTCRRRQEYAVERSADVGAVHDEMYADAGLMISPRPKSTTRSFHFHVYGKGPMFTLSSREGGRGPDHLNLGRGERRVTCCSNRDCSFRSEYIDRLSKTTSSLEALHLGQHTSQ